jgi:hypothetical protein
LELAAKAAGIRYRKPHPEYTGSFGLFLEDEAGNIVGNWNPLAGMSEAFDAHMGAACWTDPAYAPDASTWAAAWMAAKAQPAAEVQPVAVPQGFALVPVEPTREMWAAVNKLDDQMTAGSYDGKGCTIEQAWDCMLAAAPAAQAPVAQPGAIWQWLTSDSASIGVRWQAIYEAWNGENGRAGLEAAAESVIRKEAA